MQYITTAENLTREQILTLRAEAYAAGDAETVDLCEAALIGIESDRARVATIICAAEAQE